MAEKQKTLEKSAVRVNVAKLRKSLGASRSQLAEILHASEGSVMNWEQGKEPTEKFGRRLAELARRQAAGEKIELPTRVRGGRKRRVRRLRQATPAASNGRHEREVILPGLEKTTLSDYLEAAKQVYKALQPLEPSARERVLSATNLLLGS